MRVMCAVLKLGFEYGNLLPTRSPVAHYVRCLSEVGKQFHLPANDGTIDFLDRTLSTDMKHAWQGGDSRFNAYETLAITHIEHEWKVWKKWVRKYGNVTLHRPLEDMVFFGHDSLTKTQTYFGAREKSDGCPTFLWSLGLFGQLSILVHDKALFWFETVQKTTLLQIGDVRPRMDTLLQTFVSNCLKRYGTTQTALYPLFCSFVYQDVQRVNNQLLAPKQKQLDPAQTCRVLGKLSLPCLDTCLQWAEDELKGRLQDQGELDRLLQEVKQDKWPLVTQHAQSSSPSSFVAEVAADNKRPFKLDVASATAILWKLEGGVTHLENDRQYRGVTQKWIECILALLVNKVAREWNALTFPYHEALCHFFDPDKLFADWKACMEEGVEEGQRVSDHDLNDLLHARQLCLQHITFAWLAQHSLPRLLRLSAHELYSHTLLASAIRTEIQRARAALTPRFACEQGTGEWTHILAICKSQPARLSLYQWIQTKREICDRLEKTLKTNADKLICLAKSVREDMEQFLGHEHKQVFTADWNAPLPAWYRPTLLEWLHMNTQDTVVLYNLERMQHMFRAWSGWTTAPFLDMPPKLGKTDTFTLCQLILYVCCHVILKELSSQLAAWT